MKVYDLPRPNDNTEEVTDFSGAVWVRDSHPNRRASFWYGPDGKILTWFQLLIQRSPLIEKDEK